MKIGFVGLGIMGSRMASHLARSGKDITVYNRNVEARQPLVDLGAKSALTIKELVRDVDVVISILSTPQAVEEVFLSDNGALGHMSSGTLWVDCTTVDPAFSRKCAKSAEELDIQFMDAPVAGSKPQAEAGELVFFAAGTEEQIQKVEPLFQLMGKKTVPFTEIGQGASFKMLVNMLLGQSMLIFSETVLLGEKLGLDKSFLLKALSTLPVTAPFTQFKAPNILNDEYDVQFPLEWMHKDLKLVAETAQTLKHRLPVNEIAEDIYHSAKQSGMSRLDFSAVYKYLEDQQ